MALPTTAAPTTPAAMPKPMPGPLAWACWVDEAMAPATVMATRATAAIRDLIDMRNSILFECSRHWLACPSVGSSRDRVRGEFELFGFGTVLSVKQSALS